MTLLTELWDSTDILFQGRIVYMLLLGPIVVLSDAWNGLDKSICFVLSGLALIPCAERLSYLTEQIAVHTNGTISALFNATFGNAPELLISVAALRSGYYRVIQLTMLGSMITNMIFVFGISCLIGGIRYQTQSIRTISGNVTIGMLLLSTAGSLIPATLVLSGQFIDGGSVSTGSTSTSSTTSGGSTRQLLKRTIATETPTQEEITLSRVNASVLILLYICYIIFQLGTHKEEFDDVVDPSTPTMTKRTTTSIARPNMVCQKFCTSIRTWVTSMTAIIMRPSHYYDPVVPSLTTTTTTIMTSPISSPRGLRKKFSDHKSILPLHHPHHHGSTNNNKNNIMTYDDDHHSHYGMELEEMALLGHHHDSDNMDDSFANQNDNDDEEIIGTTTEHPQILLPTILDSSERRRRRRRQILPTLFRNTTSSGTTNQHHHHHHPKEKTLDTMYTDGGNDLDGGTDHGSSRTMLHLSQSFDSATELEDPMMMMTNIIDLSQRSITTSGNHHHHHHPVATIPGRIPSTVPPSKHIVTPHLPVVLSFRVSVVWLFIITLCVSAISDILVDTIDEFAYQMNLSQVFTSMIIIPFFSNVAEQVSAFLFAYRNEMDLVVGVTIGSAIQIATFVLPGSVLIGYLLDRGMTLYFHSYETVCLLLCTLIVAAILQGGTTNWLVGAMLVGVYIMLAAGIWFHEIENLSIDTEELIDALH